MHTARATRLGLLLGLLLLVAAPFGAATADDVPEAARKKFEEARGLYLKGDAKSLAAAFSAVSELKAKAPDSVDFWELYVRVWRANKKPEADLWEKIIGTREQAAPKSAVFDLVRARVETDPAKKTEYLQKAIDKDPAAMGPKLMMARHLAATGEDAKAEDLLDKVLAEHPDAEEATVLKAELMVQGGLSRSAMSFAKEALTKKDCPALRHVLAKALHKLAEEDASLKDEAIDQAKKAVEGKPDPEYVATLSDLLEETDKPSDALALLKTHFEKTKDPRLASRLGSLAFRAGDYDAAAPVLAASAATDLKSAKALALAHARRGRAKEARAAVEQVLALDKDALVLAGAVEHLLGDLNGVRRRLAGRTDDLSKALLLQADAEDGKVAEVAKAVGQEAGSGSRAGEDLLLDLLQARLYAKLGAKGVALRKQMRDARTQAAGAALPEAQAGTLVLDFTAKSGEFMDRAVTYLRSACGTLFQPKGQTLIPTKDDEGLRIGFAVVAEADCQRDPRRVVRFNAVKPDKEGNAKLEQARDSAGWEEAEKAFAAGCASLLAEDPVKAAESFAKAAEKEPSWHRPKLFAALAKAFIANADLAAAAKEAQASVSSMPGDWDGRTAAIVLSAWAGLDVAEPVRALEKYIEERCPRHFDALP